MAVADKHAFTAGGVTKVVSHPLFLLLMGALVTGLIVPYVTRQWQIHQTAQDMKTQVIGDDTTAVGIAMTEMDVTQNPVFAGKSSLNNPTAIDSTYVNFMTKSEMVQSELRAYFPSGSIPTHWNNLFGLVHDLYLLTYATQNGPRSSYARAIKGYFDFHHIRTGADWSAPGSGSIASPAYRRSWLAVEHAILTVRDGLNSAIMAAPAPGF